MQIIIFSTKDNQAQIKNNDKIIMKTGWGKVKLLMHNN